MTTIYLFDVDGTLTAPRQSMTKAFAEFFLEFVGQEHVFLVSGSDYGKLKEQVPLNILKGCRGVFGCTGAELFINDNVIFRKEHKFSSELLASVETYLATSAYEVRCGNHIEQRTGMINVSVVGRNASLEERKRYHAWDLSANEREKFVKEMNQKFINYEASCGGEISVDIVPRGWNKSVVKAEVLERFPGARLVFFGDRMNHGGNDKPLADVLNTPSGRHAAIPVQDYKDTWMHLNYIKDAFVTDDAPITPNQIWEKQAHSTIQ